MSQEDYCSTILDFMAVRAEGDPADALVEITEPSQFQISQADVLVVGGGTGGIAAALAAARAGRTVILLEETDWIGGQMTAQGISALDEHDYIERFGGTRSYYLVRNMIRRHYANLSTALASKTNLNPGNCWVSALAFEPRVAREVLLSIAEPFIAAGRLKILTRTKVWQVQVASERIESVLAFNFDDRNWFKIISQIVIDATELGDVLPLAGAEYVIGAECAALTGEPHAQPREHNQYCVQSFTYPFVLENTSGDRIHTISKPQRYEHYRDTQPYSLRIHVHGGEIYGDHTGWLNYQVLQRATGTKGGLWQYRRLIDSTNFPSAVYPNDLSMFNWPGNDYRDQSILDRTPIEQAKALQDAKRVSLGFCYWLQTEAHRTAEQKGFPELKLRPDIMDSCDGLSKYPYIRESRRICALQTVVEQDVSAEFQTNARARHFADSVGIGWYPIDIHRVRADDVGISCRTKPFQIPLGALIPKRLRNLLAGAKNIGTTHITNGCYRLHPVEWNIGEAAGILAAFAVDTQLDPAAIHGNPKWRRMLQQQLVDQGVPLYWFTDVGIDHTAFSAIQMAAVAGEIDGVKDTLEFAGLPTEIRKKFNI